VHVRLTPRGKERVDAALADLLHRERDLLAGLARADQEELSGLLRRLVAPFEPHA
jgi:DNA-binding MarR family transcriptional regulator